MNSNDVARGIRQERDDRKQVNTMIVLFALICVLAWIYVGLWLAIPLFVLSLVLLVALKRGQAMHR